MSGAIDPKTLLQVSLSARSWNAMLSCASEGLGALSAVIADVQRQCMQQTNAAPSPPPEHIPARTNGAAAEAQE
jgi:hypothetical protein